MGLNHKSWLQIPSLGVIWNQIYHLNTVLLGLFCPFFFCFGLLESPRSLNRSEGIRSAQKVAKSLWGLSGGLLRNSPLPWGQLLDSPNAGKKAKVGELRLFASYCQLHWCSSRFTHFLIPAVPLPGYKSEHHLGWSRRTWWLLQVSWQQVPVCQWTYLGTN